MRHFRNVFFVLAAFLWLPVSAHCQLETIPGLEFLRCTQNPFTADESAQDCSRCCTAEKSSYPAPQVRLTVPTPQTGAIFLAAGLPTFAGRPAPVSAGVPPATPLERIKTWPFILRTALPARAPSLAS